jgi:hypothetical protein
MTDTVTSTAERPSTLSAADRAAILHVARESVNHGLMQRRTLGVDAARYSAMLQSRRATFVTLHLHGSLRGCIGTLDPRRALIEDVAYNAHAAAFHDPRFPGVTYYEYYGLEYHVSILTPATPMSFTDEAHLLSQLQPGVDGLVLEEPALNKRGTFLPSVWEMFEEPERFWSQLKLKAGLAETHWSDTLRVSRYGVEAIV